MRGKGLHSFTLELNSSNSRTHSWIKLGYTVDRRAPVSSNGNESKPLVTGEDVPDGEGGGRSGHSAITIAAREDTAEARVSRSSQELSPEEAAAVVGSSF